MIVELRWIGGGFPPARDEFEQIEMAQAPAVGDMVTTPDRSGEVISRLWVPLPLGSDDDNDAVVQVTVKRS